MADEIVQPLLNEVSTAVNETLDEIEGKCRLLEASIRGKLLNLLTTIPKHEGMSSLRRDVEDENVLLWKRNKDLEERLEKEKLATTSYLKDLEKAKGEIIGLKKEKLSLVNKLSIFQTEVKHWHDIVQARGRCKVQSKDQNNDKNYNDAVPVSQNENGKEVVMDILPHSPDDPSQNYKSSLKDGVENNQRVQICFPEQIDVVVGEEKEDCGKMIGVLNTKQKEKETEKSMYSGSDIIPETLPFTMSQEDNKSAECNCSPQFAEADEDVEIIQNRRIESKEKENLKPKWKKYPKRQLGCVIEGDFHGANKKIVTNRPMITGLVKPTPPERWRLDQTPPTTQGYKKRVNGTNFDVH